MNDWILIVGEVFIVITIFICVLFFKHFIPSYITEKGKNLATKEDIQEITDLTESVQQEFRKEIESFKSDLHFKYDFYYKQYEGLYSYLYANIIQSEYVRQYIKTVRYEDITFDDEPFITISPIIRTNQKIEFKQGEGIKYSQNTEEIETAISKFSFDTLVDYIVANSALADQKLMKYAVGYRFFSFAAKSDEDKEEPKEEMDRLQKNIICSIIVRFNELRKELGMEYEEKEIETRMFEIS